jgi:hypothetical protein
MQSQCGIFRPFPVGETKTVRPDGQFETSWKKSNVV